MIGEEVGVVQEEGVGVRTYSILPTLAVKMGIGSMLSVRAAASLFERSLLNPGGLMLCVGLAGGAGLVSKPEEVY